MPKGALAYKSQHFFPCEGNVCYIFLPVLFNFFVGPEFAVCSAHSGAFAGNFVPGGLVFYNPGPERVGTALGRAVFVKGAAIFPEDAVVVWFFKKCQNCFSFVVVSPAAVFGDKVFDGEPCALAKPVQVGARQINIAR